MRRFQIIKKTTEGILRTTVNTEQELRAIVAVLKEDDSVKYIVVKDRTQGTRGMIWRRGREEVDWWILDPPKPTIQFRKPKGLDKDSN